MKTIGAKEFRINLDKVLDCVLNGEDIVVTHRFKKPVRLTAFREQQKATKKLAGLRAFDAAIKQPSPFDANTSLKKLYNDSIAYKYNH